MLTTLLEKDIIDVPGDEDCVWPSLETIKRSQEAYKTKPKKGILDEVGVWKSEERNLIPDGDLELQLKLLVVGHCARAGHRGSDSTYGLLRESFCWKNMQSDCKEFVQHRIHCMIAKEGNRVSRLFSLTLHGSKQNEVVNFDYVHMGVGTGGFKYVLVIRDDGSSYCWLSSTKAANTEVAAKELSTWMRVFKMMPFWVSDQGSHFKKQVMQKLAEDHSIEHMLTVAYSPGMNGTAEKCIIQFSAVPVHADLMCRIMRHFVGVSPRATRLAVSNWNGNDGVE